MPQKHEFSLNNETFYFWTEGSEKNPPLVLLPGFTGTHDDLLDFARQFKENYFVIVPNLPGWGNPKGTYHLTIDGYTTFLHDLLKSLTLKGKILLAGHCMGSTIAVLFASRYPHEVEKLFLIGPSYLGHTFSSNMFVHLAQASMKVPKFLRPLFFFFRSRIFAIPLGFFVVQTKSLRKKLKIIFTNTVKQQFQDEESVEKNWNSLVLFDYRKLGKLSVPVHILHGEKDILIPPQQIRELLAYCPNATFDIIPHAGHMPPVETPEALAHLMEKYFK